MSRRNARLPRVKQDEDSVNQVTDEESGMNCRATARLWAYPTDGKSFARDLRDRLYAALNEAEANFPANDSIEFVGEELVIRKPSKEPEPPNRTLADQAITASMPQFSILDLLSETEQWLDLHKLLRPLSGSDAKIDNPSKRLVMTLFCYGCNLGPNQTARSVKGLTRKQVARLTLKTRHGGAARLGERDGDQRVQPVPVAEIPRQRQAHVAPTAPSGACTARICCPNISFAMGDTAG
ncbi:Tn3 family transposase [Paraburkholderia youngii]|uniref:Tn3 family transposase n=1 Tax=Paraburkholderia youngii TaxID=2782701 RepID=UPI0034A0F757